VFIWGSTCLVYFNLATRYFQIVRSFFGFVAKYVAGNFPRFGVEGGT
jgi:hypothetical protein